MTWRELLAEVEAALVAGSVSSAHVDARRLVERASGLDGTELVLGLDRVATKRGVAHLDAMLQRRIRGEPLQYVVGRWGFRSLDLLIDARALIPRPETEQVAELALAELRRRTATAPVVVADLGTGSGAIALSVAKEMVTTEVWASDISADALALARANLAGLGRPAARVRLVEGDWFAALPGELVGRFDLVVSNPPYVAETDELPAEVADWEPTGALVAGPTGREHLERIVAEATAWLAPSGSLVLELAPTQAPALVAAAGAAGFTSVEVRPDLAGCPRVLVARRR
ncbi:MAG TPA: peptide chain release factor N(5)-glutamine methyltransferase [Acidimicrobiales bacterium]|nr:peptide chain release factor N(5)-glutamine methyltransferase [Acidimicrobiales bacterium]